MGEGVSEEILSESSSSNAECGTAKTVSVRSRQSPERSIKERRVPKPDKLGTICSPGSIRTIVVRDVCELARFNAQWKALARDAVDANVFYEPWWLLPSLHHLHACNDLLFLLMFAPDPACPTGPELLCGMFPFEYAPHYRGLPVRVLRLLRPTYNRLCTPLVHREFAAECIGALLDWAEYNPESAALFEFRFITGEGRVAQELHQQITDRQWRVFQSDCTIRALFKAMPHAELYLQRALRGTHRKELRRLENRLSQIGRTKYLRLGPGDDARPWLDSFLELESSGWKGQSGSSLGSREETRRFFEESASEAHRQGQLMMLGLFHKDRPIALKCNHLSGNGSFAFKIAFDEEYGRYSPGMLLEVENVRQLHEMREIAWMDSTAESQHLMINRLWIDRRTVETLVVSPDRAWANFIVSSFPFLRWVKGTAHHVLESIKPGNKTQSAN